MKKQFSILLTALLLCSACAIQAGCSCDPCCCGDDAGFSADIELLYWQPIISNLHYAFEANGDIGDASGKDHGLKLCGHYRYIRHNWEAGVRASVTKHNCFCGWDFGLQYTYFYDSRRKSTFTDQEDGVVPTFLHGGFNKYTDGNKVVGNHTLKYQTVDFLFSTIYCLSECIQFEPFWGVEWLGIDQSAGSNSWEVVCVGAEEEVNPGFADEPLTGQQCELVQESRTHWSGEFSGAGLKFGSGYRYHICGCEGLSLFARGSLALNVGKLKNASRHKNKEKWQLLCIKSKECTMVPGVHLAAGLDWSKRCDCWDFDFGIGYEFLNWWNIPTIRRFVGDKTDTGFATSATDSTLGFHGLFLRAGIGF